MRNVFTQIIISSWKEFLLLLRDKTGLLVLFMMPSALVIIVTLVQENVMELTGEKNSVILFLDQDQGLVGEKIKEALLDTGRVTLVEMENTPGSRDEAVSMVNSGDYQVCVLIPSGISGRLETRIQALFADSDGGQDYQDGGVALMDKLPVFIDPGLMPGFRAGTLAVLEMAIFNVEMDLKIKAFDKKTTQVMEQFQQFFDTADQQPDLGLANLRKNLLGFTEETVGNRKTVETHSAVQYNIPAWSLFALFFTAIPLAGSLLLERNSGIWQRLLAMPVSYLNILIGKIISYVVVCFCQLLLIVLIGRFVFPQMGLPAFIIGSPWPLIIITLCCSLAACGYGIFLGSFCSTLEQASMFGSISIVIAAALGGTMVPVYAMPRIMQRISEFSPLNWGLTAYQDILVRNSSLSGTWDDLAKLLFFFLAAVILSWKVSRSIN